MNRKLTLTTLIMALMLLAVSAVSAQDVTIRYALWDTNQLPAYEECASVFMENSDVTVEIEQLGWGD
ncbi:MAG: sugar ABC transporter substrate-binding protein, partial [Aggregatilineales bacterium]